MLAASNVSAKGASKGDRSHIVAPRATSAGPSWFARWTGLSEQRARLDGERDERQLAIARLGARDGEEGARVILAWLDESPVLEPVDWFDVTRALAPHAHIAEVRRWLARILSGAPFQSAPSRPNSHSGEQARDTDEVDELDDQQNAWLDLCRGTAAQALAHAGDGESIRALVTALGQGPSTAHWAQLALYAQPPRDLAPLLETALPSAERLAALDELGDQRAFEALREIVRRGTADLQAQALLALFHQGQLETVEVAKHWATRATSHARLMGAAAEILLAVRDPAAPAAFETLLKLDLQTALSLAARFPSASLAAPLLAAFERQGLADQSAILRVIALAPTKPALDLLARELTRERHRSDAARALAETPAPEASESLLHAVHDPSSEALATRALVLRRWFTKASIPELDAWLQELARSARPERQALGQWGLAVNSEAVAQRLLDSGDWWSVNAATSTLFVHSSALTQLALEHLISAKGIRTLGGLALGLSVAESPGPLARSDLHALVDEVPALSAVVAPLLTSRSEQRFPWRIANWFDSEDPDVRAAALLGLATNPDSTSAGLLEKAYFETPNPKVRRAALAAIRHQPSSTIRTRTLDYALSFEPDPEARRIAESGELAAVTYTRGRVWRDYPTSMAGELVLLEDRVGRAYPFVVPPDGHLVVLGLDDAYLDAPGVADEPPSSPPAPEHR